MRLFANVTCALVALAVLSTSALAKVKNDWGKVEDLDLGTRVWVEKKNGMRYAGTVSWVDSDSLSLYLDVDSGAPPTVVLRRDEVRKVRKYLPRFVGALLGFGVALGVGTAIGAGLDSKCNGCDDPGLNTAVIGTVGAPIGAAVGSNLKLKGKTVYEAP